MPYDLNLNLFQNYWITAYRNFKNNTFTSILNLLGLSLGISCFAFIGLYVYNEYSYDRHIPNSDQIYRVTFNWKSLADSDDINIGLSLTTLPEELTASCPEIEFATGISKLANEVIIKVGNDTFQEESIFETDTSFFKVFSTIPLLGDLEQAIGPTSIMLTKSLAKKYFGDQNPIQKTLLVNNNPYQVVAVLEDTPENSSLRYDALLFTLSYYSKDWCHTYFKVYSTAKIKDLQEKINGIFLDGYGSYLSETNSKGSYQLEKLTDIHLGNPKLYDAPKGNKLTLVVLMTIAMLVLTISCVNYVSISVAMISNRQTEAGIRKVFGANSIQTRLQYIFESLIILLICSLISCILIALFWDRLKADGVHFIFNFRNILVVLGIYFTIIFSLSIFSGSYIAARLLNISVVENLKQQSGFKGNRFFRYGLIVFQFTASIMLIFTTIVVNEQMGLIAKSGDKMDIGKILIIDIPPDPTLYSSLKEYRHSLEQLSFVKFVSFVGDRSLPTFDGDFELFGIEVNNQKVLKTFTYVRVDENFFNVLNIPLIKGRYFNQDNINSEWETPIVNESFISSQNWANDPLQHKISYSGLEGEGSNIIGVVQDFGFHGFHRESEPMIFYPLTGQPEKIMVRMLDNSDENVVTLKRIWKSEFQVPMESQFLDDYFALLVEKERVLLRLMLYFSVITIVIAGLGLFGVINVSLTQRKKDIAIHKILGARLSNLLALTWKEYSLLMLISIVLAYPISFLLLQKWLESFPDKVPISAIRYIESIGIIGVVICLAVAFHAIQILKSKSLKWIRNES